MIARLWSAQTTLAQAPAYREHLQSKVLPALQSVPGYGGAMLLERALADAVEILVITYWQSVDAIRGFAGTDLEGAVVAEDAAALLTHFDGRVRHFEVVIQDFGPPAAISARPLVN
jgi:heme-degrading monooxygenase HmoA